jgi:hypothetical protein
MRAEAYSLENASPMVYFTEAMQSIALSVFTVSALERIAGYSSRALIARALDASLPKPSIQKKAAAEAAAFKSFRIADQLNLYFRPTLKKRPTAPL